MATITIASNVRMNVAPPDQFIPTSSGVALTAGFSHIEAIIDVANMPANTDMGFNTQYGYTVGGTTTWRDGAGASFNSSQLTDALDQPTTTLSVSTNIPQSPYPDHVRVRSFLCTAAGRATYSATLT